MINAFFEKLNAEDEVEAEEDVITLPGTSKEPSLDEFYDRLRQIHESDDLESGLPFDVQHQNLRPTLRSYQKHAIKWMLTRELRTAFHTPSHYIKIRSKFNVNHIFFYNKCTFVLETECPSSVKILPGGLLTGKDSQSLIKKFAQFLISFTYTDEMGLGKTVEIIGLILMNPRTKGTKRKADELDALESDNQITNINSGVEDYRSRLTKIKCICHTKRKKAKLIKCTQCSLFQHSQCVVQGEDDLNSYICPFCWKSSNVLIDAQTTVNIVNFLLNSNLIYSHFRLL